MRFFILLANGIRLKKIILGIAVLFIALSRLMLVSIFKTLQY